MKYIKVKNSYLNYLAFTLFLLSYYFFFLSLEKCTAGEGLCGMKLNWIKLKIIQESISCFLSIILFELMILKKISKLHLVHFIIIFVIFYAYSHGVDFDDHGNYNIKFFFIIVISILILIFVINFFFSLKHKKVCFLLFLSLLIFIYLFSNLGNNLTDCKEWPKGLNNTYIDNNKTKYNCQIKIPKSCTYKIGQYFFDRNRYLTINCEKEGFNSRNTLLKSSESPYINENTTHIGYPLVNKDEKFFHDMEFKLFPKFFYNNFIDMNNSTLLKSLSSKMPEISIDFSKKKNGQLNINLIFNETLSNERKKLEKFIKPFSENILMIYIDSVSRATSIRQLKKTLKFFEKFMTYKGMHNSKSPSDNFHSFQFFKYYSFRHYTLGNYPLLFYGNHSNRNNTLITSHLKRNGFITAYTDDSCYIDFIRIYHNFSYDDVYDHQYIICDPNKGPPSSKLTCLYGKIYVEHMFEYSDQFWRKYKRNRKFSALLTNFAHESSLEMLKYMDNIIYNYLNNLFNDNLLKDTSIFLLSDHGVSLPSIYYLNDFFKYERLLPMFYLLVNDRNEMNHEDQYKYIYLNQQTFITGFDIYSTIIHLVYGDKYGTEETSNITESRYGQSLFTKINQKNRGPKKYYMMDRYACT